MTQSASAKSDQVVGVIGLGYVGLPLAIAFARAGRKTIGIDIDPRKVASLSAGQSYILDVESSDVAALTGNGLFSATLDYDALRGVDAIFICVPTPYDAMRAPDLSYIRDTAEGILPRLGKGQLIVLQSTTYPGTTEEIVLPILERSGLKAGVDFDLAFSPERIDPGRRDFDVRNTPKVVGGLTPGATERASILLSAIGAPIHPVSSPRAAEMTKLLENIFRSVNIALVNEMAMLCDKMNIDIWEVIDAAATKPFGFMPFRPGPGLGGHCIPIDPFYLTWKAREFEFHTEFIELAGKINSHMPDFCVGKLSRALNSRRKPLNGSRVLVIGVAYKPDVNDMRESPALKVIELLMNEGAEVSYHDPHVPTLVKKGLRSVDLTPQTLGAADAVAVVTNHSVIDWEMVARESQLVVDFRNVVPAVDGKVWRL